jgi:hypothetical protein
MPEALTLISGISVAGIELSTSSLPSLHVDFLLSENSIAIYQARHNSSAVRI